ncbi:MAG: HDIG domain-containing protein [Anaerolineales bacterium]|nr:HDIG domain-containing protein [Anaerolineales bacterium]
MNKELFNRRTIFLAALLLLFNAVVLFALLYPQVADQTQNPLQVGEVAPYDIQAPYPYSYESQILTEIQRQAAADALAPVYTTPDTNIARKQLERLRSALAFIISVRADLYATQDQKMADLSALEDIEIKHDTALAILEMSDLRWQAVSQEAIIVLEQVMRNTIRENRVEDTRRSVPTLVSLSLSEDQALIVAELVTAFVAPNSIYNEEMTQAARQQARENTPPVVRTFLSNETIVKRGEVISETDLEALQEYGLAQPASRWQDTASAIILTIVSSAFLIAYLQRATRLGFFDHHLRSITILTTLWLVFLVSARLIIPEHTVLPFAFPIMAYGLTIAALYGAELTIATLFPLAVLSAFNLPYAVDLIVFYTLSGIFGILALRRAQHVTSFFWAGAAIAVSGALVTSVYHLQKLSADWVGLATLAAAAVVNGMVSAGISLVLHYFLAQLLDRTTNLQLIELSRPDHPLLQFILRNAPGTYQHSLQLSNLVEQAAERIGADAMLARVGALYHDAGKAANAFYFVENQQVSNVNPHDDLDPEVSAANILRHVRDGIELARKYRLPSRIQDFILEHHGTMITRYQYARATEAVGDDESLVDIEKFRYPGPRPRSRETALLMLADGCEARMRAEQPRDEYELAELIRTVIKNRLDSGQLDDSDLTLRELALIQESFIATLRGVYHPRIAYPSLAQDAALPAGQAPALPEGATQGMETPPHDQPAN